MMSKEKTTEAESILLVSKTSTVNLYNQNIYIQESPFKLLILEVICCFCLWEHNLCNSCK